MELITINPEKAREILSQCEEFSDEQIKDVLLNAFEEIGSKREFPPGVDTSREGLLDLLYGLVAVACGQSVQG